MRHVKTKHKIKKDQRGSRDQGDQEKRRWQQERASARRNSTQAEEARKPADEQGRADQECCNNECLRTSNTTPRVLGLSGNITRDDVRKKYRDLAAKYHPDHVYHLGDKLKETAAREMKEINEAFEYFKKKYGI